MKHAEWEWKKDWERSAKQPQVIAFVLAFVVAAAWTTKSGLIP
jgi:hypothetical protein